jgi:hypothetical protein
MESKKILPKLLKQSKSRAFEETNETYADDPGVGVGTNDSAHTIEDAATRIE